MSADQNAFPFTHSRLEAIKPPTKGRATYRDTKVAGLSFVITANNSKSFYFVKWLAGKAVRIGGYPDLSIDDARKAVQKLTGDIARGEAPRTSKQEKTADPTVAELFAHWHTTFAKTHKKTWKEDQRVFDKYCTPLHKKRLSLLTKADIVKWHHKIGEKHGRYQANRAFQLIRSLFRVGDEIGYDGPNPCSKVRMFPEESRERFLMPDELRKFHEAVMAEEPLWRDLLFMLLFTGQRKRNVCRMQWKDLDLERGLWYVAGEQLKNGSPLVVVLSTQAAGILDMRNKASDKHVDWVFPSERSKGPVADAKKAWEQTCPVAFKDKPPPLLVLRQQVKRNTTDSIGQGVRISDH